MRGGCDNCGHPGSCHTQRGISVLATDPFTIPRQIGFALYEVGACRRAASKQVAFKVPLQACIAILAWWALGHAVCMGACRGANCQLAAGAFSGGSDFFLAATSKMAAADTSRFGQWMLQVRAVPSRVVTGRGSPQCKHAIAVPACNLSSCPEMLLLPSHWKIPPEAETTRLCESMPTPLLRPCG
jgi:hypothetical protein